MKTKPLFPIFYEDNDILVVYKRSGLLSIATEDGNLNNLYHYVREYLNRKRQKVFIVHRLDRDTSGVMVFAKSIPVKEMLQSCFEERKVTRLYEALVKGNFPLGEKKHIVQYLVYDPRSGKVYPTKDKKKGKEAITDLETVAHRGENTAIKISISTGRPNQIRIALKSVGYPLLGDKKYSDAKAPRMMLNAYALTFPNELPIKKHSFVSDPLWVKKEG